MTVIAVTGDRVSPLFPNEAEIFNATCEVAITRGQLVYFNANGRIALSAGGAAGTAKLAGIALQSGAANQVISIIKRGHVGGYTISQAYGALGYVSNTAGALDDAAGTVSKVCGVVVPLSDAARTKVFYVNADQWMVG
jgi:hypothetical protein